MTGKKIAVGQINTTVGSFEINSRKIVQYTREAHSRGANVICFPEMAICGYPPLDLLDRPAFLEQNSRFLNLIADEIPEGIYVLVGYVDRNTENVGKGAHNAAAVLHEGNVVNRYYKTLLPTYDVFNEARYFQPGKGPEPVDLGFDSAITICEDIWNDPDFPYSYDQPQYETNPLELSRQFQPDVLFNLSASPFIKDKDRFRTKMVQGLAEKYNTAIVLANMIGGNDSLVFDGTSLIVNSDGDLLAQGESFQEDLILADFTSSKTVTREFFSSEAGVYEALKVGLSNYLYKSGYSEVVLGLSGGIDSAFTATLAADAIGADNVLGVLMPSITSSEESVTDAKEHAEMLGIRAVTVDVGDLFENLLGTLSKNFEKFPEEESGGVENKNQHRIRGDILSTLANKYGYLHLCTGNKTELALGYTTLYGDLTGILAPISDVPKTMVYHLVEWRNEQSTVIPKKIINKPPSAELAIGQRDEEDLGSYETIDKILKLYLEDRLTRDQLVDEGFSSSLVDRIIKMIDLSEYKRRQSPTSLKATSKRNFGGGRIVPEVHAFYRQEYD